MTSSFRLLVTVTVLLGACVLLSGTFRSGATIQPELITLQSTGDVIETYEPVSSISVTEDEQALRMVSGLTGEVESYRVSPEGSLRPLGRSTSTTFKSPSGYGVRVEKGQVTVFDPAGKPSGTFTAAPTVSVAFLISGDVAVASPNERSLIHVYSPAGQLLQSFGAVKERDRVNGYQNRFLSRGKILVDAAGDVYYVYNYVPLIQKYSHDGTLQYEVAVKGEAVDLQQALARRFFEMKKSRQVGGIDVINGAAVERQTGHVWIAMNGSSVGGVVYEYDGRGRKLREYALQVQTDFGPQRLTGVRDIAVTSSHIFVLTTQQQIYGFSRTEQVALNRSGPALRLTRPALWTAFAPSAPRNLSPAIQTGCPNEQPWGTCSFNCPAPGTCVNGTPPTNTSDSSTQDCKAALFATLTPGYTVVSASCTQYQVGTAMHTRGGCKDEVTICRSGTNSSHSVTLDCPAQTCSSGGGEEEGGGGGDCNWTRGACDAVGGYYYGGCCCDLQTPVLFDALGDGFLLTDAAGGVDFDLSGDGAPERLSWTAPGSDDGWLALDRNGNGLIDNGQELFGNFTSQPPPPPGFVRNGFNALAVYDAPGQGGNGDGVIDQRDAVYSSLRLWQDANHNGVSEPVELHALPSLEVVSIRLDYKESRRVDGYGNRFRYRAKVDDAKGARLN